MINEVKKLIFLMIKSHNKIPPSIFLLIIQIRFMVGKGAERAINNFDETSSGAPARVCPYNQILCGVYCVNKQFLNISG